MTYEESGGSAGSAGEGQEAPGGERTEESGGPEAEGDEGGRFRRGWSRGLGFLSAFKEAIDETLEEARERGDLSPDRAKEIMRGALDRAQEAAGEAKERLDLVPRREFEALEARVEALEARLAQDGGQG